MLEIVKMETKKESKSIHKVVNGYAFEITLNGICEEFIRLKDPNKVNIIDILIITEIEDVKVTVNWGDIKVKPKYTCNYIYNKNKTITLYPNFTFSRSATDAKNFSNIFITLNDLVEKLGLYDIDYILTK